jgi:catechol 2,3-dioxygenase-like lactoylglutathione lyase family enzyme
VISPAVPLPPHLLAVGFSSADAASAAGFFCEALGFRRLGEPLEIQGGPYADLVGLSGATMRLLRLGIGGETLELTEVLDPGPGGRPGRPIPADSRSNDRWFQHICLVVPAIEPVLERLRPLIGDGTLPSPISSAPQRLPDWNAAAAGIVAYKLRDPEGHPLELLQFPPDKGEARWHATGADALVLGIDHSAIGIADSGMSRRFYSEALGLRLAGDGVNSGVEQDHLDGLEGTRVRISSLRCPSGAGVEGLDYREPGGGRPMPRDLGPQDAAHWQLRLRLATLEGVAERVRDCGGRLISPGIMELAEQAPLIGARRALQVADPDGHRLQLLAD